jgi:hypothetical protein
VFHVPVSIHSTSISVAHAAVPLVFGSFVGILIGIRMFVDRFGTKNALRQVAIILRTPRSVDGNANRTRTKLLKQVTCSATAFTSIASLIRVLLLHLSNLVFIYSMVSG